MLGIVSEDTGPEMGVELCFLVHSQTHVFHTTRDASATSSCKHHVRQLPEVSQTALQELLPLSRSFDFCVFIMRHQVEKDEKRRLVFKHDYYV